MQRRPPARDADLSCGLTTTAGIRRMFSDAWWRSSKQHPDWSAVSGICCDEDGHPTQLRWDRDSGVRRSRNVFRRACGVTVFMRRSLVEAIGEWDESYGPRLHPDGTTSGGSEDGEYVLRAITAGFTIGFEPTIRVFHADFRPAFGDRRSMRKAYAYGVDQAGLLRQYGFSTWYAGWRSVQLVAGAGMFLAQGKPGTAASTRRWPGSGAGDADA